MTSPERQKIVVGILYNQSRDKVLLSRRSPAAHQGGLMEFPGGKSLAGETPLQTLKRELQEEIDIELIHGHHLTTYDYDYDDRQINLSAWIVDKWRGDPKGNEEQELNWTRIDKLTNIDFPRANIKLISAMELPSLYLITPDRNVYGDDFFAETEDFVRNGVKLLQFRSPSSSPANHKQVIARLLPICEKYDCKLIYNGSFDEAVRTGAHGVHLNSTRLLESSVLTGVPDDFRVAASCHNNEEITKAQKIGVDFCVLSPVRRTALHSHAKVLGWGNFSSLVQNATIPVYALGGIKPGDLEIAKKKGAHGIAMISGLWDADDPVSIIMNLRNY